MKGKNCLIFGGSGQIGRHLIRKLTQNDYRVIVVTRNIHQKGHIIKTQGNAGYIDICLLYTSPSPRDGHQSRIPSSA